MQGTSFQSAAVLGIVENTTKEVVITVTFLRSPILIPLRSLTAITSILNHRMPIPFYKPAPSPPNAFKGVPLPRTTAHWLSTLFFHWITPILRIGYSRPLEAEGT